MPNYTFTLTITNQNSFDCIAMIPSITAYNSSGSALSIGFYNNTTGSQNLQTKVSASSSANIPIYYSTTSSVAKIVANVVLCGGTSGVSKTTAITITP